MIVELLRKYKQSNHLAGSGPLNLSNQFNLVFISVLANKSKYLDSNLQGKTRRINLPSEIPLFKEGGPLAHKAVDRTSVCYDYTKPVWLEP